VTRRRGCATARCDRRRPTAVLAVAVALCVGGCTSSGTAVSSPFAGTRPALEKGPAYEVKVQDISGLGPVLVDGQGIALYLFETDVRGAPSRCYDICAVQWPPALLPAKVSRPIAGPGIVPSLLGTAPRTDGTTQLTYNGWPLYLWPPDRTPGTATGQALTNAGGRWYVVDPAGNAVITK
jgi:predicted lipoprotein with Yx(FWY)xxD motif